MESGRNFTQYKFWHPNTFINFWQCATLHLSPGLNEFSGIVPHYRAWAYTSGWETYIFWHSPELGSVLYSLYNIPLAQACFPLAQPNFHSHWWAGGALVSQPALVFVPPLVFDSSEYGAWDLAEHWLR